VIRNCFIVAVMFWAAFTYQNNHRDFSLARVEVTR
jgi:hypothetical protein